MPRSQRYDHDPPSPALHFAGSNDGVFRVIAALHDDIRTEELHEIEWRVVRENYYQIDTFERRQHVAAFGIGANWTSAAFEPTY